MSDTLIFGSATSATLDDMWSGILKVGNLFVFKAELLSLLGAAPDTSFGLRLRWGKSKAGMSQSMETFLNFIPMDFVFHVCVVLGCALSRSNGLGNDSEACSLDHNLMSSFRAHGPMSN